MKVLTEFGQLRRLRRPVVLAAGFFDGVHRGHRKILAAALEHARARGGQAWVLTFDTHPLKVLNPGAAPPLLTTTAHKLRVLERLGLDGCLVLPFTRDLAAMAPHAFVDRLLAACPPLTEVLVGRNWRFGRQGGGDPALLARLGAARGLTVTVIRAMGYRGETISSTRVRLAVQRGNLDEAAALLGRPFSILGTVVPGRHIGRLLGCPTANLDPHNEALPPTGVYAACCCLAAGPCRPGARRAPLELHPGVVNLGTRPTFNREGAGETTLEVHILDVSRNLYGQDVEVFLAQRLRDEKAFATADALRAQIARDIAEAGSVAASKKLKESLYTYLGLRYSPRPEKQKR